MTDRLPLPDTKKTKDDVALAVARGALGAVPFAGTVANELIGFVVVAPAERRLNEWQTAVTDTINQLIETVDGVSVESLSQNDEFLSAVIETTSMVMRTSRIDKRRMLQAAIFQIGAGMELEDFVQNTFWALVERYTPEHVRLLDALNRPEVLVEAYQRLKLARPGDIKKLDSGSGYIQVEALVPFAVPDLERLVSDELYGDLHRDGLCVGSVGFQRSFYPNKPKPLATDRGRAFLRFVSLDEPV